MDSSLLLFLMSSSGSTSVEQLEQELGFCESLLWLVIDHLKQRMSTEEHHTPFGRFLLADNSNEVERILSEVDLHISANRNDLALKLLRAETATIWDDLHKITGRWQSLSNTQKRRWIRFARLAKVLREIRNEEVNKR